MRVWGWLVGVATIASYALCGFGQGLSDHYWTRGCVSADGTTLAMIGDETVLVDVESGRALSRDVRYLEEVACLPDGRLIGLATDHHLDLRASTRGEGGASTIEDLIGVRSDSALVLTRRRSTSGGRRTRWLGPAELEVRHADRSSARTIALAPELFGYAPDPLFSALVVRVLADDRVLAATRPPMRGFATSDPLSLQFHAIDPRTSEVTPVGGVQTPSGLRTGGVGGIASTRDGSLAAIGGMEDGELVVVLLEPRGAERCRIRAPSREVGPLVLDDLGTHLAVALVAQNGDTAVATYDARTCEARSREPNAAGSIAFLGFLSDGSVLYARSDQRVRRVAVDGAVRYDLDLSSRE